MIFLFSGKFHFIEEFLIHSFYFFHILGQNHTEFIAAVTEAFSVTGILFFYISTYGFQNFIPESMSIGIVDTKAIEGATVNSTAFTVMCRSRVDGPLPCRSLPSHSQKAAIIIALNSQ